MELSTDGPQRWVRAWFIGIAFVGLLVIVFTFRDYGITWDESVQARYGELVLEYFSSGLKDTQANSFIDLKFYGPVFDAGAAFIYQFYPEGKYEIRHLLIALLALFTILGVIKFGNLFDDPYIPLLSSLILILLPRFYGHAFNNPKDIPFACFFVWSMFFMARLSQTSLPRLRDVLSCGAVVGLASAVRSGGFPVLVIYFLTGLAFIISTEAIFNGQKLGSRKNWLLLLQGICMFAVAWLIMVLPWPWAHENVVLNPLRAMRFATSYSQSYPVLFEGEMFSSDNLPRYYVIKYLWITTPPAVIFFAILGIILGGKTVLRNIQNRSCVVYVITVLWLWFPIVYFVFRRPNVYDEIRHFLFILPALAVLAGIGAAGVLRLAASMKLQHFAWPVLLILLVIPMKDLFELHPYQMTYFNYFAGGVGKASRQYETDYWVSSYKEAIQWVNQQRSAFQGKKIVVLAAANAYSISCIDHYRNPDIELYATFKRGIAGPLPNNFDFYIATTRWDFDKNFPEALIVHTVGRKGTVFTVIKGKPREAPIGERGGAFRAPS